MSLVEIVRFAGGALVGHRLRTALSIAGVAVGIAAVVALTGLGEGARRYVSAEFASLGSNLIIVLPGRVETAGAAPWGGVTRDLTIEDYVAITTRVPEVRVAAPLSIGTETVRWGGRGRAVPVLGTTVELAEVRRLRVASGRFLAAREAGQGGSEVVLGSKVARELFGAASPLGEVVRIGPWRLRVVGVLAPRGRSLTFDFDDIVMVPVSTGMRMFNRSSLFRILVEARGATEVETAKQAVLDLLADRHRAQDITVITQDAMMSAFGAIMDALTLALAGIASISLAVAGIGIMNLMLVSVTERRAEVGLLKALGARDAQVLAAFLAEAALLSSAGGVVGLGIGLAALRVFTHVYPAFPAAPPVWAVVAALVLSLSVGLVFGAWPAHRATRLDPVRALARR